MTSLASDEETTDAPHRDPLLDLLVDDGAGGPLILRVAKPLRPSSQRLMDTIGVQVEVVPVRVQTTDKTHSPDGSKTISQLDREAATFRDGQEMTVSCAACPWTYTGPAGEARDLAAAHREKEHPAMLSRRPPTRTRVAPSGTSGRDALDRMDAGERQQPVKRTGGAKQVWTRERVVAAIEAKVRELGRVPTLQEWHRGKWTPSHETIRKTIGGGGAFRDVAMAALGEAALPAAPTPEPVVVEPKSDLDVIRTLDAEELIVVGRVLQAVGSVRALERKERALPLIRRLVADLHDELTPA